MNMSPVDKPVIIMVPGAWHGPEVFKPTMDLLKQAAYQTVGLRLPSMGADPAHPSADEDIAAMRRAILEALDQEEDVVLVLHSASGMVGCDAVEGLAKKDRGQKAGVIRIVFLCALVAAAGMNLFELYGMPEETYPGDRSWIKVKDNRVHIVAESEKYFYNDLSYDDARYWKSRLITESFPTLRHRVRYQAYDHVPSTYIVTTLDNAVPPPFQEKMAQDCGIKELEHIEAGHSPFLSQPKKLADAIRRAAGEPSAGKGWKDMAAEALQSTVAAAGNAWKNAGMPDWSQEVNVLH